MKKALSLVEIIAASIILMIVFAGLLTSFVATRNYVKRANKRLVATNLGRAILNNLTQVVRQDWWEGEAAVDKPLYWDSESGAPNIVGLSDYSIDEIDYQDSNYTVTGFENQDYRQVEAVVNYPED